MKKPSIKDYRRLELVDERLVKWVEECYLEHHNSSRFPGTRLRVNEGARSQELQEIYYANGSSWTLDSHHRPRPEWGNKCRAVDLIFQSRSGGLWVPRWERQMYTRFARLIGKPVAERLGLDYEWGGDWSPSRFDGPHWQLNS